jgi:hypothetical protein
VNPVAYDLFCGLGGWTEGLLAEGYDVTGFDIEAHEYDGEKYPARLVLQDVMTLDGARLKDADLIVASPPCQEFSYMAMPWSRAKQIARALRGVGDFPEGYKGSRTIAELTALFDACFRIQRDAAPSRGSARRRGTTAPITFGATSRRWCRPSSMAARFRASGSTARAARFRRRALAHTSRARAVPGLGRAISPTNTGATQAREAKPARPRPLALPKSP